MKPVKTNASAGVATVTVAAIGYLQPGIDPVFLTILTAAHDLDPNLHGWIVGATQGGMALGALLVWRYQRVLPLAIIPSAACIALFCAAATTRFGSFPSLLVLRALFGFMMGVVYTDAMSRAAIGRPAAAYGAVFLTQLILSTLVAFALPAVADRTNPATALLLLAAAPLAAFILLLAEGTQRLPSAITKTPIASPSATPPAAWALAIATFAFICATMMIWSFTGALALRHGIDEDMIGMGVALGSIVGAFTALAVMREASIVPLRITGPFAAACLLSPLILIPSGNDAMFIAAVLLLNIGSTAIIVRGSAAASLAGDAPLFRRFVACTHPLGMIAGPMMGSMLALAWGRHGLEGGAVATLIVGCLALWLAAESPKRPESDTAAQLPRLV